MQRPVMDPMYHEEPPPLKSERVALTKAAMIACWRAVKLIGKVLTYDPLVHTRLKLFRNDDGTPASRLLRGLMYRMAFVPIMITLLACALVWVATHPTVSVSDADPSSTELYFDPVTLRTDDNVRLEAWLVPALDAKTILSDRDKALRKRQPAVILAHDFAGRRQDMLSLVKPLHDAGFVVLIPSMRGCGTSQRSGQTFGLREVSDLRAGVEMLRRRGFVNPKQIMIVGIGSGANAALCLAEEDRAIAGIVLQSPNKGAAALSQRIPLADDWLAWMRPLCKWIFEVGYQVDVEELNLDRHKKLMDSPRVLAQDLDSPRSSFSLRRIDEIQAFLRSRCDEPIRNIATVVEK